MNSNRYLVIGSFEGELGGLLHIPINSSLIIKNQIFSIILRVYVKVSHKQANDDDENKYAAEKAKGGTRLFDHVIGKIEFFTFYLNLLCKLEFR